MAAWYQISVENVLNDLRTSLSGLTNDRVLSLQKEFGKNILQEATHKSKFSILLSQFKDVMIIILIIAAAISFWVGEHTDAFVILAIIIGNAWIGFAQENNAENAVRMLQKMAAQYAKVIRENNHLKIEAGELVPGDILTIEAGDIIPADARLVEISSFKTEEAALTGESQSVEKTIDAIGEINTGTGDQLNMIFKGTVVSNGSAKAVVTGTGMNTEIGKIAGMLKEEDPKTPLQKRLAVFSKQLAVVVIIICVVVFVFGLLRGEPAFLMFLTALSLAVAALPEALPAVITIALSKGAKRMVQQKALVRKLHAVETLGSVTYICTDKTGTLTQNVMTVEKLQAVQGNDDLLKHAMLLNNEVRFSEDGNIHGDSTETALVHYALRNGLSKADSDKKYPFTAKLPFDSVRMRMSTLHQNEGRSILFVKGAPVKIMEALSDKYKDQMPQWLDLNRQWAADGLRVLFFAFKVFGENVVTINAGHEKDLDFLGMVAMIDPPREEAIEAIRQCKTAGIKVVMITGDQPLTASAIAKRLQIIDKDSAGAMTGADMEKLTEQEFLQTIEKTYVYARVSPEQKLNIIKGLQRNGEFVAMTGDGVNDAPSLKQSDIGVAMGITGTDVSKESADIILLDDNFATIVKAVKEGRRIYENIRKFILYVLSCNLAEILIIFSAPLLGLAIPLLPIHILWINLVTDGLPGLALTTEPAEKNIMNRPPRPPKENLFAGGMIARILSTGLLIALAAILTQCWATRQGYDIKTQQTMIFTLLCFVQLGNALSVRFAYQSMFNSGIFANRTMWGVVIVTAALVLLIIYLPFSGSVFKITPLHSDTMGVILLATFACVLSIELVKYITNRKYKHGNQSLQMNNA
ncbi:MAG: cation-translocating P-type ATPase [Sediminibacterium sp.]